MTPLRERDNLQAELTGLRALLESSPKSPMATPLMESRIDDLERELKAIETKPRLNPEAELFFSEGPAMGSDGLEITFTSDILNSYQNMVTNHYSAKHYGALRRSGRRRGEAETKLYLTALPRGSFGLQLSQPHVSDFVAAGQLTNAMKDISGLVESTAESDQSFEAMLARFNPRVLKPLTRFIESLHSGGGAFRLVTDFKLVSLGRQQLSDAYTRVSAAKTEDEIVNLTGVFGGVFPFSWEFEFQPAEGDTIRGPIAEDVSEEDATAMNLHFTKKPVVAKLTMTTVSTRTGKKKPTYELLALKPDPRFPQPAP